MGTPATLLCSNRPPLSLAVRGVSSRHFHKYLEENNFCRANRLVLASSLSIKTLIISHSVLLSSKFRQTHLLQPIKCSVSSNTDSGFENPVLTAIKSFSFESVKTTLSESTPIDVCKLCGVLAIVTSVLKWTMNTLSNPFFWMYFSWSWSYWPCYVAVAIGLYGIYCFWKYSRGEANAFEQIALITSVFTWLILVPPAFFNGYLEGWPVLFFFVYHYFFFFNVSVRKRMYGDLYLKPHDPKWDVTVPKRYSVFFFVGVAIGHWLAALEGPELIRIPGGWSNVGIWALIMIASFMHYHATLYLAKYSEKVVVPTVVVHFGPFRWVRHPIYASIMLLFLAYFMALRAPISSLFVVAVCVLYYNQKAVLEEALMLDAFGERYVEYMSKVPYRFIPFVY